MTIEELQAEIEILKGRLDGYERSDRFIMGKTFQLMDGRNIQLGRGTGTKIGTANNQKLGFFGKTPVAQQAHINAAIAPGATYSQSEALDNNSKLNSALSALAAFGFIA
jgi:hypothetical protein